MRVALAFLRRDFLMAISYRIAFFFQLTGIVVAVPFVFFHTKMAGGEALARYDGNAFAFILIGVALLDYMGLSLQTFAESLRESQLMGTFEIMLLSPTSLPKLLVSSSLYGYLFTTVRFCAYITLGVLFGLDLSHSNLIGALLILGLAILAFAGMGMLIASVCMVIKRGHGLTVLVSAASLFFSGVIYPTDVLRPVWLQQVAVVLPMTPAARGMRNAMMHGMSTCELLPQILALLAFGTVLVPLGLLAFWAAVRYERMTGATAQY